MEVSDLKNFIFENKRTEELLSELGCHHITPHLNENGRFFTCGNFDGDNPNAITVYESPSMNVINYTRDIKDQYGVSDIVSLVCYNKKFFFTEAIKWLCDFAGLDFYKETIEDLPPSLQWLKNMEKLNSNTVMYAEECLKPIPETILSYYVNYPNDIFQKDGISLSTQELFGIGLDVASWRITIPIRDELGQLVGVKGRLYKQEADDFNPKYIYLEPCAKSCVLFGLDKTLPYIKQEGVVYCFESEKAVMQMWSHGVRNCVSIGGHSLSRTQVEKITRLNADVIICYDKDVKEDVINEEKRKFLNCVKLYYLYDKDDDILDEKESPADSFEKFKELRDNHMYVL